MNLILYNKYQKPEVTLIDVRVAEGFAQSGDPYEGGGPEILIPEDGQWEIYR